MKIVFCGGGTAGHVTPAIAVAEYIMKNYDNVEIMFIGRDGGPENEAIKDAGFTLRTVKIYGIKRSLSLKNLRNAYSAIKALTDSKKLLKEFRPDVVFGTGGYVCWPVIRAAQMIKIPTLIHESNATAGLVTRILSNKCDRVLLNFEGSKNEFKRQDNIRIVGNPTREGFVKFKKTEARKRLGISKDVFLISSFGGSGGSEKLNEIMIEVMKKHSAKNPMLMHVHSCGRKYYEGIKKEHPEFTSEIGSCIIKPYINDMPTLICASDIVISRCGAMTLSELCAVGVAAILIPSPNVTNDHQYKNAKLISESGAAVLIDEKNLNAEMLISTLRSLENNAAKREELRRRIRKFHVADSLSLTVSEITGLI